MKNKCIIIYESVYNDNTLKLARAMAQAMGCRFITAGEADSLNLDEYETIGLGSGIYFGRHHPKLFELVENLNSAHQNVFIFSSRGNPFLGKYHQPLKDVLIKKGKHLTGEFSVRGYDETGPWVIIGGGHKGKPDERDLKNAVRFVQKAMPQYCMPDYYAHIKNKMPVREGEQNSYKVRTNGTMFLLKGDRVTFNHNLCNGCGKCAEICPMGIIQLENSKAASAHELDCTLCRLCVMNCRQRAITLHYNWCDAIQVARRHSKRTSLY
jgi:NAD-dependent dihydropyrimidine dehydrogenase PreA subunit/flavodoxin